MLWPFPAKAEHVVEVVVNIKMYPNNGTIQEKFIRNGYGLVKLVTSWLNVISIGEFCEFREVQ